MTGPVPKSQCPSCGRLEPDWDGTGILVHTSPPFKDGCGYCSHPGLAVNADTGVCLFCGKKVRDA